MVAGHTVTDSIEEAAKLRTLGVEPAVDDVLEAFEEDTPEEIMALDERGDLAPDRHGELSDADEFAVDDAFFDEFVSEDVQLAVREEDASDAEPDCPTMDELFADR